MNLYDVTGELLELQELAESGEVSDTALLDAVIADTTIEFNKKIENCAKYIKNLSSNLEALKAETDRLNARMKTINNAISDMKARMLSALKETGIEKVKGELFTISVRANGGKLPVIVDVKTEDLPDDLVKIEEKPDLEALAKYIEEHPENQLAHFGKRGESLSIK